MAARKYDVFLSFRGEDTRKNITDHLFSALVRHGFYTYRDDGKLERGADIGTELLKAIEESRISVIIFSRNYADSRWCLDELVKIMECKNRSTLKQIVLPVFYDVDPADVRAQRGSFAEAFAKHEERFKDCGMEGKLKKWRAALTEAANLSGWDLQNVANGHESKFIEKIVKDISNKLNLTYANVATYPVGLESRVQDVNMLLSTGLDDVRMVGIWGIGGLGKTTIAKAVYNKIRLKFKGSSFLADVREMSKQPYGLVGLQEQLLSDILMNGNQNIRNVDQGIEVIKQRLWCRRVLLVLDDVDDFNQLRALAIKSDWFHSGSRIIVTTRDKSLLKLLEVDEIYIPKLLNHFESLKLFSWHAFRNDHPTEDYVELSKKVVDYARGLPLTLEILGSFLFDKSMLEWESALEKLKVIPYDAIQEKLRISFDSLNSEEKDLFLDIACFFLGMDKKYTVKILEGCDFFPEIGIGVLSRRCLVRIDEVNCLTMHDMLRDMGREIVRKECKEPWKRSRLWFHEDVLDVLKNYTGTEEVEGLVLNLPRSNDVPVNAQAFEKMNRLRLLKLNYVHLTGNYGHLSKRLRWLCWYGFPSKSIPSNLCLEKVVAIDMRYSSLEHVWKETKILKELKFLNLSHSYHLTETPNFTGLTNLQRLLLKDCTSLVKVHQSIECLEKLLLLDLTNCKDLKKLPLGIFKLKSLQYLHLTGCSKVEKLAGFRGSESKSWFSLLSSWPSLVRNPDSISGSPASIQGLISMRQLELGNCNLTCVPDELGSLIKLRSLNLSGNNFYCLPASISHLSRLDWLELGGCKRLLSLPELPIHLKTVSANDCTSLESVSFGLNLREAPDWNLLGCHSLVGNNVASNFRKSLLQFQGLSARVIDIFLPGGEVPNWFKYQSVGSKLSFVVPPLPDQKIRGWILCIIFASPKDEMGLRFEFFYLVENKTKGLMDIYDPEPAPRGYPITRQHLTWFQYVPQHHLKLQIEAGDEVEYSIFMDVDVKMCGVDLIYEDDDEIMAITGRIGSDDPTLQSAPSTLKRGRSSPIEKGKGVAIECNELSPLRTRRRSLGTEIEDPVIVEIPNKN